MKIIDAHMHAYTTKDENIVWYGEKTDDFSVIEEDMKRAGIDFFCGSIVKIEDDTETNKKETLIKVNEGALKLYEEHSDVYLPGIVIHPDLKDISCEYIKKAHDKGITLVGELTPYLYGWKNYMDALEILEYAASLDMAISCHPTHDEDMRALAKALPHAKLIYAHPNDRSYLKGEHIPRMKEYDNIYIDLSGTGVQRYRTTRELINNVGKERILFGTDYPVCNPASYVAAVMYEDLTDDEKEHIFYKNAKRLFNLK